jgi:hypothetical protein
LKPRVVKRLVTFSTNEGFGNSSPNWSIIAARREKTSGFCESENESTEPKAIMEAIIIEITINCLLEKRFFSFRVTFPFLVIIEQSPEYAFHRL